VAVATATRMSPNERHNEQNTFTVLTVHDFFLDVLKTQSSNPQNSDPLPGVSLSFQQKDNMYSHAGKFFELNFVIRKTFLSMVKPDGQNHHLSWSICQVPSP